MSFPVTSWGTSWGNSWLTHWGGVAPPTPPTGPTFVGKPRHVHVGPVGGYAPVLVRVSGAATGRAIASATVSIFALARGESAGRVQAVAPSAGLVIGYEAFDRSAELGRRNEESREHHNDEVRNFHNDDETLQ